MVGETGLEPATSRTPCARSSHLNYSPSLLNFDAVVATTFAKTEKLTVQLYPEFMILPAYCW